jgi:hypothetical protein
VLAVSRAVLDDFRNYLILLSDTHSKQWSTGIAGRPPLSKTLAYDAVPAMSTFGAYVITERLSNEP